MFRELATAAEAKITMAKAQLANNLAIWEQNFRGLADHLIDNGLKLETETEALLGALREALVKEKAKLDAELAPKPAPAPAESKVLEFPAVAAAVVEAKAPDAL